MELHQMHCGNTLEVYTVLFAFSWMFVLLPSFRWHRWGEWECREGWQGGGWTGQNISESPDCLAGVSDQLRMTRYWCCCCCCRPLSLTPPCSSLHCVVFFIVVHQLSACFVRHHHTECVDCFHCVFDHGNTHVASIVEDAIAPRYHNMQDVDIKEKHIP